LLVQQIYQKSIFVRGAKPDEMDNTEWQHLAIKNMPKQHKKA